MTDADFIETILDKLLDLAWVGAAREAKRRKQRAYCPSCAAGPLARIFVTDVFPRVRDGSVSPEIVEAAGALACAESYAIHRKGDRQ